MTSFTLIVVLLLGIAWGLYFLWRRRVDAEIAEGAASEYARLRDVDAPLMEGMDERRFADVYARVETPRFPAYALTSVTAFVLGTPLVLGILSAIGLMFAQPDLGTAATQLQMGDGGTASLANRVSTEELQYILQGWSGFYYFFGMLAFWIVILIVVMRRYHARTPGFLREEVLRSR